MEQEQLLTAKHLSERLGDVSPQTIYVMNAKGLIPSVSIGAKLSGRRFSEKAVREALLKLTQPPRPYHPRKEREPISA